MIQDNHYKETKLGLLPEDWKIDKLGSHYEIQQGKALSRKEQTGESPYHFLRTSNVLWGELDLSTLDTMDFDERERNKLELQERDLLICEGGDIGRTAIWNGQISNCYYQNHIFRVRSKSNSVSPLFHMFWMHAGIQLLGLYRGYGNKTTIPNLSKTRLSSFPIPIPPIPEQNAIAHVLSTIRKAIDATKEVIASARELKRSMMKHLYTYGPIPIYKADKVEIKEIENNIFPQTWKSDKLSDLVDFSRKPRNLDLSSFDMIPFFPMDAIPENGMYPEYVIEKSPEELTSGSYCEAGDLMLAKITPSFENGKQAIIADIPTDFAYATTEVYSFHPKKEKEVNLLYIFHYLRRQEVRSELAGKMQGSTGRQRIPKDVVENLNIPLPSIREQETIVSNLGIIDEKIKMEENREHALETLFDSLLHHLMTGKVRVQH